MASKEKVLETVDDLVVGLLYYDRKEDEELPRGEIEAMISRGEITVDEIVNRFSIEIRKALS